MIFYFSASHNLAKVVALALFCLLMLPMSSFAVVSPRNSSAFASRCSSYLGGKITGSPKVSGQISSLNLHTNQMFSGYNSQNRFLSIIASSITDSNNAGKYRYSKDKKNQYSFHNSLIKTSKVQPMHVRLYSSNEIETEGTDLKSKVKGLWKNYGYVAIGTYFCIYVCTLSSIFLSLDNNVFSAQSFNFDPVEAVKKVCDLFEGWTGSKALPNYIRENPRGSFISNLFRPFLQSLLTVYH